MKQQLRFLLLMLLCAVGSTAWGETVTDVLNLEFTGVTGTSYTNWSGKTGTSGAVYAGNSAGGYESIQLRTNNSNSGVITTASGGKVKKITVEWDTNTASGRTLNVYGKNSKYSAATDLYNSSTQGTLLGTIVNGTSTELTISGDYEYIGFRSNSGAMYLTSVSIDWEKAAAAVAMPTITPNGGSFLDTQDVEISCTTEDASIYYTTNGTEPTAESTQYTGSAFEISATTTVKAIAIKGEAKSGIAEATFTKLEVISIADARAKEVGTTVLTKGVVTSINGDKYYIQDADAAICLYTLSSNTSSSTEIKVGDEIVVGGKLATYKGLVEISDFTVYEVTTGTAVEPTVTTIANILADFKGGNALQSKLVKIEKAIITAIDGSNVTIAQGSNKIEIRSLDAGDATPVVGMAITLTGNIGCYDKPQIENARDIELTEMPAVIDIRGEKDPIVFNVLNSFVNSDDYTSYENASLTDKAGNTHAGWKFENVKKGLENGISLNASNGKITLPTILSDNNYRVEVAVVKGQVNMNNSNLYVPETATPNTIIGGTRVFQNESAPTIANKNSEEAIITYLIICPNVDVMSNPGLTIENTELMVGEEKVLNLNTASEGEVCIATSSYDVAEVKESVDATGKRTFTLIAKAEGEAKFMATIYPIDKEGMSYAGASAWFTVKVNPNTNTTLFYEGFSGYTSAGDVTQEINTTEEELDCDLWTKFTKIYFGGTDNGYNGACGKMGTSKATGSMTAEGINLQGEGTLTFMLKKYGDDTGKLNVNVGGATADVTEFTPAADWTKCTVNLTEGNGNVSITFATSSKRAYIDEITLNAPVEGFTFTISELATDGTDCYATISNLGSGNYTVAEGVEVSTVVVDENGKLTYPFVAKSGEQIPGNGAFLVKGAAGEYSFQPAASSTTTIEIGENMLYTTGEGNIQTVAPTGKADNDNYYFYKLARDKEKSDNSVGFYWGNSTGSAFTYGKGHQAYLAVLKENAVNVQAFSFDGTTGIAEIQVAPFASDEVYTLSGIRVDNSKLSKGVYIVNGKKVIIK